MPKIQSNVSFHCTGFYSNFLRLIQAFSFEISSRKKNKIKGNSKTKHMENQNQRNQINKNLTFHVKDFFFHNKTILNTQNNKDKIHKIITFVLSFCYFMYFV